MRKIKKFLDNFDQVFVVMTGLFLAFWAVRALPVDETTFIRLIYLLTSVMFFASLVYFSGLIYQLVHAERKVPLALKSLSILSVLGLAATAIALAQIANPVYGLGVLFMYAGVFLYTAIKGNH